MILTTQVSKIGGDPRAPIGTEGWAEFWKEELCGALAMMFVEPGVVAGKIAVGSKYEAWKLLKDATGKHFTNFDDFCRAREPHGLARDPGVVRGIITLAEGKRRVDLLTVPPSQQGARTDLGTSRTECEKLDKRQQQILRAIAERSPEVVRDLYGRDLIGAKEAASLGRKSPTPEQAVRQVEIANGAKAIAEASKDKRQVNAYVRRELGTSPDPIEAAARAIAKIPRERLGELLERLPPSIRRGLVGKGREA